MRTANANDADDAAAVDGDEQEKTCVVGVEGDERRRRWEQGRGGRTDRRGARVGAGCRKCRPHARPMRKAAQQTSTGRRGGAHRRPR